MSVMKKMSKTAPSVSRSGSRPFLVPAVSLVAIVLAFVAVLFAFNTVSAEYVNQKTERDIAKLQNDVVSMQQQLERRGSVRP